MFYYTYQDKICFSQKKYVDLPRIDESQASHTEGLLYALLELHPQQSRRSFCLSTPGLLELQKEGLNLLQKQRETGPVLPSWLLEKINNRKVMALNRFYPDWDNAFSMNPLHKWRVHIAGLGDVGGTLLMGLRLMGGSCIDSIGIFDRSQEKLLRWQYEINQIYGPSDTPFPSVDIIAEEDVFNCDLFVFCIAAKVPAVGEEGKDVRMVQLEENAKILSIYGKQARASGYKGLFAVVSDPVDLLCKSLLLSSNQDEKGIYDFKGLAPEQIRGYGLGVMHARALYYANQQEDTIHYEKEGRAFGPHGADLVIADSIENYHESRSLLLTEKAKTANLEVRKVGFKPFIAPALSSGALSLIATIKGNWHYSATYMGGVYMGARNRYHPSGTEIEMLELPQRLLERLQHTYTRLENLL
ncbi:lactate dehydrogenase [Geosporobacter ferrireducens]|uniref:Lactate dehydrogenase n=1 Tax=Geosporobacter ferrireducens TaxID=1424294 RepID=A0A1D8GED2_9FIRM|nr:lactate dehydrogenase [Geosporobacter ferrireducens]AOT69250.1 lactate dehydrogenase [Geosporobacter ferrireducens]MTI56932.1 lactate dehydrogenase [Geosporobacter ferrireducens]